MNEFTVLPAEMRRAAVLGANHETHNLGSEIAQELERQGIATRTFSPSRDKVSASTADLAGFDTVVFANGFIKSGFIGQQYLRDINTTIAANLTETLLGVDNFVKDAERSLDPQIQKHIVIVGSMAAQKVLTTSSAYCAAKAGLEMFARCAAWELAPKGFDVFLVNPPSIVDAPIAKKQITDLQRIRGMDEDTAKAYFRGSPIRRPVTKADVAQLVAQLVQGNNDHLTGDPINMNGGAR